MTSFRSLGKLSETYVHASPWTLTLCLLDKPQFSSSRTGGLFEVGITSVRQPQTYLIKRHFFKYMNRLLNLFDQQRFEVVGGERLCAEWVLKCGGRLRWSDSDKWLTDYNNLPSEKATNILTIQDIDVSGTVVMNVGFRHLWHVKDLKSFKMHDCKYLDDNSLKQLQYTANSLQNLQVSANKNITDTGLLHLVKLVFLTDLHLKDLPAVKDKKGTYEQLLKALPKCDILFPDIDGSNVD